MKIFSNQGPWGQWGGGGNNGGNNGNQPPFRKPGNGNNPDVEKILKEISDKLKDQFRGGGGSGNGDNKSKFAIFGIAAAILWLSSGIYVVNTGEQGVVMRFGAFNRTAAEGLNYHLPSPIEDVIKVPVAQVRQIRIDNKGSSVEGSPANFASSLRKVADQPVSSDAGLMMLTGDENLVDVSFIVQWQISNAADYLFRLQTPETTIGAVAESAMREVIGQSAEKDILSGGRGQIESTAKEIMQKTLDGYKAGVSIISLQMQSVQPPSEVLDKFRDVQTAKSDKETAISQAIAYKNKAVTEAKGKVAQLKAEANAYSKKVVENSLGEASRFSKVYDQYVKAKEVTKSRMYFETMEGLLKPMNKIIIDSKTGVMPYLPLDELRGRQVNPAPIDQSSQQDDASTQYIPGVR